MSTDLGKLHDQIAERVCELQEEIAALESEIAAKQAAIDELRALLPPDDDEEEERAEPAATKRPKKERDSGNGRSPEPAGGTRGRKKGCSKYPALVREVLLKGPATFTEIVEALGTDGSCIRKPMNESLWFEKVDPGNRLSQWRLTEAGQAGS